jgi:hypothetical protein
LEPDKQARADKEEEAGREDGIRMEETAVGMDRWIDG